MQYLLDANVLIDAKRDYYPMTRVPDFWEWLLELSRPNKGLVKIPHEVYQKLTGAKNDNLAKWLKQHRKDALLKEEVDQALLMRTLKEGYNLDFKSVTPEQWTTLNEDPFLIAYALKGLFPRCVVTNEVSKPKRKGVNRKLPDVCGALKVECINIFKLIEELDFKTDKARRDELSSARE